MSERVHRTDQAIDLMAASLPSGLGASRTGRATPSPDLTPTRRPTLPSAHPRERGDPGVFLFLSLPHRARSQSKRSNEKSLGPRFRGDERSLGVRVKKRPSDRPSHRSHGRQFAFRPWQLKDRTGIPVPRFNTNPKANSTLRSSPRTRGPRRFCVSESPSPSPQPIETQQRKKPGSPRSRR
jgi:hypothetical protein